MQNNMFRNSSQSALISVLRPIKQQPFIFFTGMAALIHSTWSLGTLFAGNEPQPFSPIWFAWLLPALLIAFSLDVGQIATSDEIRSGHRTRAKYATFFVFSTATYYLQWVYMASHIPAIELSMGVRTEWLPAAHLILDASLWIVPGLLPLSTLLYTFSYQSPAKQAPIIAPLAMPPPTPPRIDPLPALPVIEQAKLSATVPAVDDAQAIWFRCPDCDFSKEYPSAKSASMAGRAHGRACKKVKINQ